MLTSRLDAFAVCMRWTTLARFSVSCFARWASIRMSSAMVTEEFVTTDGEILEAE